MTVRLSAEERVLLIDSLKRFLDSSWPVEGGVERSEDPSLLRGQTIALAEMGLTGIGAAEGPGIVEGALVQEELGKAGCPTPLCGAIIANLLLEPTVEPHVQSFLADVQSGEAIPALALASFDGDHAAGSATYQDGEITADLQFVEDCAIATHLIVFVAGPAGIAILPMESISVTAEPGLAMPALSSLNVAGAPLIWMPLSAERLVDAAQLVRLLHAARALGAAQRAFDLALEHALVRRQFGHVIGEFQALQHKLVDCLTRLDGTRLALRSAADACDQGDASWRIFANAVLAYAGPSLRQLALEAHHVLGAIGYAEEHEAPRHFRRIHADLLRFGGAARARAELADYLLRAAA